MEGAGSEMKYVAVDIMIGIVVVLFGLIMVTGIIEDIKTQPLKKNNRMVVISIEDNGTIVYDKDTMVEYWKSNGYGNTETLTLLIDDNGDPLIYKGE